jgi:P2 family phage contractile tail tube protein
MNQIPEVLTAFRAYNSGKDLLGVVDVTLPDIETLTETIKGAGVAGEMEVPVVGHTGPMTLTLNFRTETESSITLLEPKAHHIDIRGAIQSHKTDDGTRKSIPLKVVVRATPKKKSLGKLETGSMMDVTNEFDVTYLKVTLNNNDVIEIDKLNYIYAVNGTDYLIETRAALGI